VAKAPFGAGPVGHACFLSRAEFTRKSGQKGSKKFDSHPKSTPKTGMENTPLAAFCPHPVELSLLIVDKFVDECRTSLPDHRLVRLADTLPDF
jgi:hypothetical protein